MWSVKDWPGFRKKILFPSSLGSYEMDFPFELPKEGGSKIIWNVGSYLQIDTASYPWKLEFSSTALWDSQISKNDVHLTLVQAVLLLFSTGLIYKSVNTASEMLLSVQNYFCCVAPRSTSRQMRTDGYQNRRLRQCHWANIVLLYAIHRIGNRNSKGSLHKRE